MLGQKRPRGEERRSDVSAWDVWCGAVEKLRPAFSRRRAFLWFLAATAAFAIRENLNGVTSFVRVLELDPALYHSLLRMFHSSAVDVATLADLWTHAAISLLGGNPLIVRGMIVFATDGIKVAKSGRKMPAVKTIHQESDSNTKPEYITGHSCLSVSLMAVCNGEAVAVPVGVGRTARPPKDVRGITRGCAPDAQLGEIHPREDGPEAIQARSLTERAAIPPKNLHRKS